MIDTTTINYAMEKLEGAFHKVAPHAVDLSEKYVQFVVIKEVVPTAITLLMFLAAVAVFKIYFDIEKISSHEEAVFVPQIILTVVCAVAAFVGLLVTLIDGSGAIVALLNPEMFAIHQLIK